MGVGSGRIYFRSDSWFWQKRRKCSVVCDPVLPYLISFRFQATLDETPLIGPPTQSSVDCDLNLSVNIPLLYLLFDAALCGIPVVANTKNYTLVVCLNAYFKLEFENHQVDYHVAFLTPYRCCMLYNTLLFRTLLVMISSSHFSQGKMINFLLQWDKIKDFIRM